MIVDAALEGGELAALAEIEQLVAAEHPARMGDEGVEQIIFAGRERDGDAVLADQLALAALQHPRAEAVAVGVGRAHRAPFSPARRSTALIRASSSRGLKGLVT